MNIKFRYLIVGGVNTVFGYLEGLLIYTQLEYKLHIIIIGILINIISISFSFITTKLFVFQTKGRWLSEYLKSYVVYGGVAILSTLLMWLLVEYCKIAFWIAQALIIISISLFSFIAHKEYTFKRN